MFFNSSGSVIQFINDFTIGFGGPNLRCHFKKHPFSSLSNSFPVIEGKAFRPKRWMVVPNSLIVSVPCMWWWNSRPRNSLILTGLNLFFRAVIACSKLSHSVSGSIKISLAIPSRCSFNWYNFCSSVQQAIISSNLSIHRWNPSSIMSFSSPVLQGIAGRHRCLPSLFRRDSPFSWPTKCYYATNLANLIYFVYILDRFLAKSHFWLENVDFVLPLFGLDRLTPKGRCCTALGSGLCRWRLKWISKFRCDVILMM